MVEIVSATDVDGENAGEWVVVLGFGRLEEMFISVNSPLYYGTRLQLLHSLTIPSLFPKV